MNVLRINCDFKKLLPLKILTQEKITRSSGANSEHKHSKIERFLTLNEWISQNTLSLSIVNKFSDVH